MNLMKCGAAFVSILAAGTISEFAHAQDTAPPPATVVAPVAPTETNSETVTQKGGPSRIMLTSGIITFGVTYGAGAIVGATSPLSADQELFVPIAGPWMDFADRPGCGGNSGRSCDVETTYKVLLVADGIGQAIGALTVVEAFLNPEVHTTTHSVTASEKPSFHVTPASLGAGGYGVLALGNF
jgi:hypothetical protein